MSTRRIPNDPFFGITNDTKLGRAIIELKDRTEEIVLDPGQAKYSSVVDDLFPVLHYLLDESGVGVITDRISNRDGTLAEADAFQVVGPFTGSLAITLDGTNDRVVTANDVTLQAAFGPDKGFSIEIWFKGASGSRTLAEKRELAGNGDGWTLLVGGGKAQFQVENNTGSDVIISTSDVDDDAWHQIVAVRDAGADELRLYVDGVQDATPNSSTLNDLSTPSDLSWGGDGVAGGANGEVSNAVLYDSAITGSEIQELFNATFATTPGDNLGDHTATQNLNLNGFNIVTSNTAGVGAGPSVTITAGDALTDGAGGAVNIVSGGAADNEPGGQINLTTAQGGPGPGAGTGGRFRVTAGAGGAGGGAGGTIGLFAGNATLNAKGGSIDLNAGAGEGTNFGGDVTINAGNSGSGAGAEGGLVRIDTGNGSGATSNDGGQLDLLTGTGGAVGGFGGAILLETGAGSGGGGPINIETGDGITNGVGGTITITAGDGGLTSGIGGNIDLKAGDTRGGNNQGGFVNITGGEGEGGGSAGDGGDLVFTGGVAGATAAEGGYVRCIGGVGGSTGGRAELTGGKGNPSGIGNGGVAVVKGGEGGGSSGGGGRAELLGGAGTGGNPGGDVTVQGGAADGGNAGGDVSVTGGLPGSGGIGGKIAITAANSNSIFKGANVEIDAGNGAGTGDGGDVDVTAGTSSSATAVGGDATVTGGAATAGTGKGGDVILTGGTSAGGAAGVVKTASPLFTDAGLVQPATGFLELVPRGKATLSALGAGAATEPPGSLAVIVDDATPPTPFVLVIVDGGSTWVRTDTYAPVT